VHFVQIRYVILRRSFLGRSGWGHSRGSRHSRSWGRPLVLTVASEKCCYYSKAVVQPRADWGQTAWATFNGDFMALCTAVLPEAVAAGKGKDGTRGGGELGSTQLMHIIYTTDWLSACTAGVRFCSSVYAGILATDIAETPLFRFVDLGTACRLVAQILTTISCHHHHSHHRFISGNTAHSKHK